MSKRTDGLIKAFKANGAISRYAILRILADGLTVQTATAVSQPLIGVSAEPGDIEDGQVVDVLFSGIAEVKAGAAFNAGAWLTTNASGQAVESSAGTDELIGKALQAANAAGDVVSFEIIKG